MKIRTISLLLFLLPLLLFSGYAKGTLRTQEPALGEEFTIKVGQQVTIKDTKLKLSFVAVPEDSRCPSSVVCAWAGNAKLNLEIQKARKKVSPFSLNTLLEPKGVKYKGYQIRLIKLSPYPVTAGSINPADYEATLVITSK